MYRNIFIISGGCPVDSAFFQNKIAETGAGLFICCDGGARHLPGMGIKPDVLIGDMDSIDPAQLAAYSAEGTKIVRYSTDKDFTDTELALDYALDLKPQKIFICCGLGGRIDHTLSNILLLVKGEEKGIETLLMDEYSEVFVLNKERTFLNDEGKTVSLIALTPEVTGITLTGFLYSLKAETLTTGESRGISNLINADRAVIRVQSGKLLVVKYHRKDFFPEAI